jgi:hypothetical protein
MPELDRKDLPTDLSDRLAQKMELLLSQVPAENWPKTMAECESLAGGRLKSRPRRTTPKAWSEDLFSDTGMKALASDKERALIAYDMESPHDLILNLLPIHLTELIRDAVSSKLAELLKDDEAGWHEAARWIDKQALEEGIDLWAEFDSPEKFARSLLEGMRFHCDLETLFPRGPADWERFEVAEELFWHLMPHRGSE